MTQTTPSEVFHPSVFILEEMAARDWNRDRLASAMCEKMSDREFGIQRLTLDFYLDIGPNESGLRMGKPGIRAFARAFGTSEKLWKNLEEAWLNRKQ